MHIRYNHWSVKRKCHSTNTLEVFGLLCVYLFCSIVMECFSQNSRVNLLVVDAAASLREISKVKQSVTFIRQIMSNIVVVGSVFLFFALVRHVSSVTQPRNYMVQIKPSTATLEKSSKSAAVEAAVVASTSSVGDETKEATTTMRTTASVMVE